MNSHSRTQDNAINSEIENLRNKSPTKISEFTVINAIFNIHSVWAFKNIMEQRHEKTRFLPMRKQSCRSASQLLQK